ncbi:MAG: hypothetical protein ACOCWQ_02775, partial [Nanoarchaeota archaeon]
MRLLQQRSLIFGIVFVMLLSLTSAIPLIEYGMVTPSDQIDIARTFVEINVSVTESDIDAFVYTWNDTNYTLYNDSLILLYNFDNISALGENDTHFLDVSSSGFNGTADNGTAVRSTGCRYDGCVQFDGVDDAINVSAINFGQSFTVSAWINPSAWGDAGDAYIHNIFCNEGGTESTFCFRIGSKGQPSLRQKIAVAFYEAGAANDHESNADLSLSAWQ